jgi:hypothetical protein
MASGKDAGFSERPGQVRRLVQMVGIANEHHSGEGRFEKKVKDCKSKKDMLTFW